MYVIFIIYNKIMKRSYICTIIDSSERDCFTYLTSTLSPLHLHKVSYEVSINQFVRKSLHKLLSKTWNLKLTMLVKILNTSLLTIVTKKSISDIAVVLDTSLEQVPLAALLQTTYHPLFHWIQQVLRLGFLKVNFGRKTNPILI